MNQPHQSAGQDHELINKYFELFVVIPFLTDFLKFSRLKLLLKFSFNRSKEMMQK